MEAQAMRRALSSSQHNLHLLRPLNLVPRDSLAASNDAHDDDILGVHGEVLAVSSSFALPRHSEAVWKHDNLCDFFLQEQLHRRVVRVLFALTENMADIWEQMDFNFFFHFIPKSTIQDVLQPYVVEKPSIAVFGPTNSGKTTLLNVLLGKWWLPEQETPNTEVVWRISNGKRPQRLRRSVESEKLLVGSGEWNIEEWLCDGFLKEKALRQRDGGKEVFFDLRLPNHLLSCGVDLWDTPSLNFDKWSMFERLIFKRRNVIPIFIVDAQECLGEDRDVRFIKTMRRKFPNTPFLIVLGRIDVSLMQLRMDHSLELSTLDSDDEEKVVTEVSKCELMRVKMQIPTAKFHNLIASTHDIGAISADKVWDELSHEQPEQLRYTKQFNEFIELLLESQGKRIQRPFFRIYARLMQAIFCAKTCLKIIRDETNKDQCLRESKNRMDTISNLRKSWTDCYSQTQRKYRDDLQSYLTARSDEILKFNEAEGGTGSFEKTENYVTNVLVSQAIDAANAEVGADFYKKCNESLRECLKSFEGSAEWLGGIFGDDALKLSNDFFWDRSLIQAAPLKKYILQQFSSRFRKNQDLQRVQQLISSIDYDRILSTIFSFYDALDNDVQSLFEISKHMHHNISLTSNLKNMLSPSHKYLPPLESRINLLCLLTSTLDKMHKGEVAKISNEDDFYVGPLPIGEKSSKVAYTVLLQQNHIQNIEKSLKFINGSFSIDNETFLKPLAFSFDYRKHFVVTYHDVGPSLHQFLTKESCQGWNLQQAVSMAMDLHRAFEYFFKTTKKKMTKAPDWGPQFIMLQRNAEDNWRAYIVLMGEVGPVQHYSKDQEVVHLPANYEAWTTENLMAHQVTVAFWLFVMKLLIRPPVRSGMYRRQPAWKYYMSQAARDPSLVTEAICWFFCSAFNSTAMRDDLRNLLKAISEKFHHHGFGGSSEEKERKSLWKNSSDMFLSPFSSAPDVTHL